MAYRDLVLYRGWERVALLYTGQRDGDGSGASTFHLQHLLLQNDVDCLTRRFPRAFKVRYKDFSSVPLIARYILCIGQRSTLIQNETISCKKSKIQSCFESKMRLVTFVKGITEPLKLHHFLPCQN